MRGWIPLAVVEGILFVILVRYYYLFPVFPQFLSADFEQHVRIATDVSRGSPANPLLLYGGIEYYLALFIKLFYWVEPLSIARYAMGLIVMLLPLGFYFTAKELFASDRAAIIAALLSASGFIWFNFVYDSGLYANFFGVLCMLALVTVSIRLIGSPFSMKRVGVFGLIFAVSLLSHYSILSLLASLFLLAVWMSRKRGQRKQSLAIVVVFSLSLLAGLAAFPSLKDILLGFLTDNSGGLSPQSSTWLSALTPLPVLSFMVQFIDPPDPFRSDLASLMIFTMAFVFMHQAYKKRDWKKSFTVMWFASIVSLAPLGPIAWRFALIGLVPLALMASSGLDHSLEELFPDFKWTRKRFYIGVDTSSRKKIGGAVLMLMVLPAMLPTSWAFSTLLIPDSHSKSDHAVVDAINAIRDLPNDCGRYANQTCGIATVSDFRLTYSGLMGSKVVELIQPEPYPTPETIQTTMANRGMVYFIATKDVTISAGLPYCANPGGQLITLSVTNSTKGNSIEISVSMLPKLNRTSGPLRFLMDGLGYGQLLLDDGKADVAVQDLPKGQHDIRVRYQFTGSNVITVFMGEDRKPIDHQTFNYCDPWSYYSDDWGAGAKLAYQNDFVRIWRLSS